MINMGVESKNTFYLPENIVLPTIHPKATIVNSTITGDVVIEEDVFVINAVIRADEGTPFYISKGSNIQDFVTLHAYFTQEDAIAIDSKLIYNKRVGKVAIFIGENVSISHGVLVHGPVSIDNNTFIGFKSTIESSIIGKNVEIGAHSYIVNVTIPDNTGIAPGSIIREEDDIKKFLVPLTDINSKIVNVNLQLTGYYNND